MLVSDHFQHLFLKLYFVLFEHIAGNECNLHLVLDSQLITIHYTALHHHCTAWFQLTKSKSAIGRGVGWVINGYIFILHVFTSPTLQVLFCQFRPSFDQKINIMRIPLSQPSKGGLYFTSLTKNLIMLIVSNNTKVHCVLCMTEGFLLARLLNNLH